MPKEVPPAPEISKCAELFCKSVLWLKVIILVFLGLLVIFSDASCPSVSFAELVLRLLFRLVCVRGVVVGMVCVMCALLGLVCVMCLCILKARSCLKLLSHRLHWCSDISPSGTSPSIT